MRLNDGVEWALHCCLALAWQGAEGPVRNATLAATFDLPPTYLNKQLQALVRAGILRSTPGPKGGFWLARAPAEITLMDVVDAIEGREDVFACQEIRQRGMGEALPQAEFRESCVIAAAMRDAETAWRRSLSSMTIADIQRTVDGKATHAGARMRRWLSTGTV